MRIRFSELQNRLTNTIHRSNAKIVESIIEPSLDRERFFKSDDYSIGKVVVSENTLYEIIDKRSNYVVLINAAGNISKKFPDTISPISESITYATGTFKGLKTSAQFLDVLESSNLKDVVAAIKAIDKFNQFEFQYLRENAERIGLNMTKLEEATTAEQLQAVTIVASSFGIHPSTTDTPADVLKAIKKKVATTKLSDQQRTIYKSMLQMLDKIGLVVEEDDLESKVLNHIELKKQLTKAATTDGKVARHSGGNSLNAKNNTHRMQMIRKITGDD